MAIYWTGQRHHGGAARTPVLQSTDRVIARLHAIVGQLPMSPGTPQC